MRPCAGVAVRRARRGGVALEQRVLGLGVERGGRLVEHEQQRLVAHEAARQRQLLPLAERDLDAVGPGRPELGLEPGGQALDTTSSAPARPTAADDRRLVVEPRHVAEADRLAGAELEAEEVLERAGQALAPLRRPACAPVGCRRRGSRPRVGS